MCVGVICVWASIYVWASYHTFHWKCYLPEIHQIHKLGFLIISRYKLKLKFWCNVDFVPTNMGVVRFGIFRGCGMFSGICHCKVALRYTRELVQQRTCSSTLLHCADCDLLSICIHSSEMASQKKKTFARSLRLSAINDIYKTNALFTHTHTHTHDHTHTHTHTITHTHTYHKSFVHIAVHAILKDNPLHTHKHTHTQKQTHSHTHISQIICTLSLYQCYK